MVNYYNEFEPKAAAALRQLIKDGLIPHGEVDERSIADVQPKDLDGFTQCHFFAGIGGWPLALQLAGWPAERPVWTGSCPCQPFSHAGNKKGKEDERHLWPIWFNIIRECQPPIVFGEQVASSISHGWLDGVYSDMEAEGYAVGSAVLPACAVNAPHKRDRLWFVANSKSVRGGERCSERTGGYKGDCEGKITQPLNPCESDVANPELFGCNERIGRDQRGQESARSQHGAKPDRCGETDNGNVADSFGRLNFGGEPQSNIWSLSGCHEKGNAFEWIVCADGKIRRIPATESGICLLDHGIPERVGQLRAAGNAIVPQVGARFIKATM